MTKVSILPQDLIVPGVFLSRKRRHEYVIESYHQRGIVPVNVCNRVYCLLQIEELNHIERAFVHVDYRKREEPEHKVDWSMGDGLSE